MVVDEAPLNHERYALIEITHPVPDHQKRFWLEEVCQIIREDLEYQIEDEFVYPIGVGCVAFVDVQSRDDAIREGPHALTDDSYFTLIPHDEGINMRMPAFQYEVWIMMLAFPMDCMTEHYVHKAISNFGKLIFWPRTNENKARVLVKCHNQGRGAGTA